MLLEGYINRSVLTESEFVLLFHTFTRIHGVTNVRVCLKNFKVKSSGGCWFNPDNE